MQNTHRTPFETTPESNGNVQESRLLIDKEYYPTLLESIKNAKEEILILMFHFSDIKNDPFSEHARLVHLIQEKTQEGIKIKCIINNHQAYLMLRNRNCDIKIYRGTGVMHAKVVLIDQKIALYGSHNMSNNAFTLNKEVSIITNDNTQIKQLTNYFNSLWQTNI